MRTAKIKAIDQVKSWDGPNGTIYYHWLQMDNGDLIDIGKKTECKVGWELTYEITDTQHKYNKAKAAKPEQAAGGYKGGDNNLLGIKVGHALNCACTLLAGTEYYNNRQAIKNAAKLIYEISEELNGELSAKPVTIPTDKEDEQYDKAVDKAMKAPPIPAYHDMDELDQGDGVPF